MTSHRLPYKGASLTLRIPPDLKARLQALATRRDTTISELATEAITVLVTILEDPTTLDEHRLEGYRKLLHALKY